MGHEAAPTRASENRPTACVLWITLLTIATAFFSSDPVTDHYVRPLFFAALLAFFVVLGRKNRSLRSLAFRLIEFGFLMLSMGSLGAVLLRTAGPHIMPADLATNLAFGLDRGVGFLLGFSLLCYGIVLWVPEILASKRVLEANLQRARDRSRRRALELAKAKDVIVRQEALVSVGELAAGVAHELRNPLAILKSALQRIRAGELGTEERERCLDVMERAVEKSNRRISGLLDLGRETEFLPRRCSVAEFLQTSVELVRPMARTHDVEFELHPVDAEATFFGDKELMLQVLVNLLRNATQAGPHEGPIEVSFTSDASGMATFRVADRGRGVEPEHIERLFTPFFSTKDDGTGLGLTVSATLVERHGGRLWLEAREPRGTVASLRLPAETSQAVCGPEMTHA